MYLRKNVLRKILIAVMVCMTLSVGYSVTAKAQESYYSSYRVNGWDRDRDYQFGRERRRERREEWWERQREHEWRERRRRERWLERHRDRDRHDRDDHGWRRRW